MSQQSSRQEVAKRYLLGTLSEEERDKLEQTYFSDDAEFDEIEIAEDELVDQYVRGKLAGDDRRRFENLASNSKRLGERIAFARVLSTKTVSSPFPTPVELPQRNRWRDLFFGQPARLAFGFGVLLVLLGGVVIIGAWLQVRQRSEAITAREAALEERRQQIERQAAETKAGNEQWANQLREQEAQLTEREQAIPEPAKPIGLVASLFLRPGETRGEGTRSEATLTRNTSGIRFSIDLSDSSSRRYRATVVTAELKPVSKPRVLTPKRNRSGDFLILEIPAKELGAGDYYVRVEGLGESGNVDSVNDYQFRIKRPQ